ncbi:hypothetical protein GCM10027596_22450 [Nocardioides korecus]
MASFMFVELSPSGGLFHFGFQLGSHLAGRGHDVTLVTGPDPELSSQEPRLRIASVLPTWHSGDQRAVPGWVRRLRRPFRGLRHVHALLIVLVTLFRTRPDAVFFQPLRFPFDAWLVRACRVVSPSTRRCIVLHETRPLSEQRREGSLYREERSLPDRVLASAIRQAVLHMDAIFVLGEGAREDVLARWRPSVPVTVVPHGDEDVFLGEGKIPVVRSTLQQVLFFGIWTRHKGIPLLIEAFRQVVDTRPEARLVIAGAVQADVDLEEVRSLARTVPGVELRPGYVDMADVPGLFGEARVVVAPYLRANQSGVVHLAQSFGRPVVASAVGDIPAAVPDGVAGTIVPPGDVEALRDAIAALLDDPELAQRLGDGGRERLSSVGSWDAIADDVARAALG